MAVSLPLKQSLGDVSIILQGLSRRNSWGWVDWRPDFHFERDNLAVDEDYAVVKSEVGDPQGGGAGYVCAKAKEWTVQGHARANRIGIIGPAQRIQLENLRRPQPLEHYPVSISKDMQKIVTKAYLVGAGTYVLNDDHMLSVGGPDDLEKQRKVYKEIPFSSGWKSNASRKSNSYWDGNEEEKKSFVWEQELFDNAPPRLFLLTDKPVLLLRAASEITEHSALLISSRALKKDLCETDFSMNQWKIIPLDWTESDGLQTMEIGYAEAMPFEFHVLPTEEMRQSLRLAQKDKPKE